MPEQKKLYFIIGIGRSGTTLLTSLLNNHPQIHALPEANFWLFFLHAFKNKKEFTEADINLIFEQIELYKLSHPILGWSFDTSATKQLALEYVRSGKNVNYQQLCILICENFKVVEYDKSQAKVILDKNPSATLYVNQISEAFPDAKFIYMVRDYRANVLSRKQSIYMKSPHLARNAYRWLWFNKRALNFQKKNEEKVLRVRYEDLAEDPDTVLKNVCSFFGVDSNLMLTQGNQYAELSEKPEILERHKTYFAKKYADLAKPVNKERINAWQSELSKKEIAALDAVCSGFASEFGYKAFTPVSFANKAGIKITNVFNSIRTSVFMNKEYFVYYFSPAVKLKRIKEIHEKNGFRAN